MVFAPLIQQRSRETIAEFCTSRSTISDPLSRLTTHASTRHISKIAITWIRHSPKRWRPSATRITVSMGPIGAMRLVLTQQSCWWQLQTLQCLCWAPAFSGLDTLRHFATSATRAAIVSCSLPLSLCATTRLAGGVRSTWPRRHMKAKVSGVMQRLTSQMLPC